VGPPLELPDLKKDVKDPALLSLGPPNNVKGGDFDLLSEAPDPCIHGRADEDLWDVTIQFDWLGVPQDPIQAIQFFSMEYPSGSGLYSQEVTRGVDDLFITPFLIDLSLAGSWPEWGSRTDPSFVITEITLTDLVGNSTTLTNPTDATLEMRGLFFSLLGGTHELDLVVYDSVTLHPIQNVDVIVEDMDDGIRWTTFTDAQGGALITSMGTTIRNRMVLTCVRDGYEVLSYSWPYDGKFLLASLPLVPELAQETQVSVPLALQNTTGVDLPNVYLGGNRLVTGEDWILEDLGVNPTTAAPTVKKNNLQFLEAFGMAQAPEDQYQWAWSNPFLPGDDAQVNSQVMVFTQEAAPPVLSESQPLSFASVISGNPQRHARVVAELPGFLGTLPLGEDLTGELAGGEYEFAVPLPPSLFVNELVSALEGAAFDPPYELVIEPGLGPADNVDPPDPTLLEKYLVFEVEEVGEGANPVIVRKRFDYVEANLGAKPPDPVVLPSPLNDPVVIAPDPPSLEWDNVLEPFSTGDFKVGAYLLRLENPLGSRHWMNYMSFRSAGTGTSVSFTYPDLEGYGGLSGLSGENDFNSFSAPGDYSFHVEAVHVNNLEITNGFIATLNRKWETYWRSARVTVTKN
jgi:hypothetical protein